MKENTIISVFAGGGGSSLGYRWAGFKELLAIDFDKNSCETLRANFDFPVWQKDIKEVTAEAILKFCKIQIGELDILDSSPPCQGFSTAGKRNLNDTRNDLFLEFVRLIKGLQPKVFIMENVAGMMQGRYRGKFNEILKTLKDTDYNVKCKLMNAMWYEVPQSRERLFFIGVRKDLEIEPSYPEPIKKIITVKEALRGLGDDGIEEAIKLTPKYIRPLLLKMKDYEVACRYTKGNRYFSHKRNGINKPSRTILKTPVTYHHKENRLLTRKELKILSSFPVDYKIIGSLLNAYNRLGNAVMPKMMYHIAKHIKENVLDF